MTGQFDLNITEQQGWHGIRATADVPKQARTALLAAMVEVDDEKDVDAANYQSQKSSDPLNAFIWKNSEGVLAPRGGYGGWSFAVPAASKPGGMYRPMENHNQVDDDYEDESARTVGYGGVAPFGLVASVQCGTEHGDQNLFAFLPGGPLVAHWRGLKPPVMSRHVYDITAKGELDPTRHAGLHTIFKVQEWVPPCSGKQTGSNHQREFSIALTGNASPDGTGYLRVTFGSTDGLFSHLVSGALKPSYVQKHLLAQTADGPMTAGGISTNAIFVGSRHPFNAPMLFKELPYPEVQNGTVPYEVHRHYDANMMHPFHCGDRMGRWREFVKLPVGETPPCTPTKQQDYEQTDDNGNIRRSHTTSSVWTPKPMILQSIRFQPRTTLTKGRKNR